MGLTTIRSSYTNLLKTFEDIGVTITESQKKTLDDFVSEVETSKKLFESILNKIFENNELAGKIQNKITTIKESEKIADAVDVFLDEHLDNILPKKSLVDYERMERLEKIHESLKDMLIVSESDIQEKVDNDRTIVVNENNNLKTELETLKKQINEQKNIEDSLRKQINESKIKDLIQEKIKDLPITEAEEMKKRLEGKTEEEINKDFIKELEDVQNNIDSEITNNEDEKNLEEALKDIINDDNETSDNTNSNAKVDGTEINPNKEDTETNENDCECDEQTSNGAIVSESVMENWIDTIIRLQQ